MVAARAKRALRKATPGPMADRPHRARLWLSWRAWLTYAIPLLALSWAHPAGIDEVVVMIAGVFVGLTHGLFRPITTCLFLLCVGQIVSLANAEKVRDTGDAILWQDLIYALPNSFENLGTLWQYVGLQWLLAGVLGAALLLLARIVEKRHLKRSLPVGIGFSAAVLLFYVPPTADYVVDVAADMRQFRQSGKNFAGNLYTHSPARFLHSITLDPAEFQSTAGNPSVFVNLSSTLNIHSPAARPDAAPDIFVILNESQFNPSQVQGCLPQVGCDISLYASNRDSALRGPLRVHTHGWGTWNAEFTLMTGVPYFWFGESGFYSAYTTAPRVRLALAKHLASLGYRTIGIYPTQKGMLNAAKAYKQYGIQEFYGAKELDLPFDWCKIPDQLMYQKLLEKYRSARMEDSRPIFMTMLTIFNHGPHGEGCMDSTLTRTAGNDASRAATKLTDYLQRSTMVDQAATKFRVDLLAAPRDILLLFFGDHQPSFEGLAQSIPRQMHRPMPISESLLFTNYQFFANYESPSLSLRSGGIRELDISFLSSTLLELASLPLGPLFLPNLQLRELCQGRLDACPPKIIDSYKAHLMQTGFYQ